MFILSCELVQIALFRRLRQKIGEAEAEEITVDEIADPRALPNERSVESTRDLVGSPPEEVFANEVDNSSSRNEDDSPQEV